MTTATFKPVVAVLGPTASGKTSLALDLAQRFGGEIVNCDSRQIYRQMQIGTAKPNSDEMKLIPHHLFDLVNPDQSFSAAEYVVAARKAIEEIWQRKRIPILSGGTGFYYAVASEGIGEAGHDEKTATELNQQLEKHGLDFMVKKLLALDPNAAVLIDTRNPRRVLRAIEIVCKSGRPLAENKPAPPIPQACFMPVVVTRPREQLQKNIATRVDQMIAAGLENEVRQLIADYGPGASGLNSIGYHEWLDYLTGQKSLAEVREQIIIHTRQYAKRQETWFRKRPGVAGIDISKPENISRIFVQTAAFLENFAL
jgi:tRNA dimethylallyltransferase